MGTLGAPTTWLPDVAKYFTNLKGIIKISLEISDKKKRHNKNKSERFYTRTFASSSLRDKSSTYYSRLIQLIMFLLPIPKITSG